MSSICLPVLRSVFVRGVSRAVAGVALSGALLALGGCSTWLSAAGPSMGAINSDASDDSYALIDLSAQTIGPYARPPDPVSAQEILPASVPEIHLVSGDVLTITVADMASDAPLFAPLASGGTVFSNVRVDAKGRISLPYVGSLPVVGNTPEDVEKAILGRLKGRTVAPVARVELVGDFSSSVLVVGAVKSPGRVSALKGPLTLLDAINSAGGPVLEPHLIRVVLRTGKETQTFNYNELLQSVNPMIPPHSEIIVVRDRKRFVAMGAVGTPGLHDLPSENPSLLEALGSVGGLQERIANASGVFIFRQGSKQIGQPPQAQVFRLDMRRPESVFLARLFLVQPEDAVYVTNAATYEWQKIITPIVQTLVLGGTINNF
jgi:polysaccharide export outer membrane protein